MHPTGVMWQRWPCARAKCIIYRDCLVEESQCLVICDGDRFSTGCT
jgi:hypothetical protein